MRHIKPVLITLFFAVNIYILYHLVLSGCLLIKYNLVNLNDIEPIEDISHIGSVGFVEEDSVTPFNRYYPTINAFGSRNAFEVSSDEDNYVVLLGDSFFFGYGLDDNETVSYFLNRFDQERRYINLGLPGANIIDSVENYFLKWNMLKSPRAIIVQVSLKNDIFASLYIEAGITKETEREAEYILYPFNRMVDKRDLFRMYYSKIVEKIHNDLSGHRFDRYIQKPLHELVEKVSRDGTHVIIVSYSVKALYEDYNMRLRKFCAANDSSFFMITDLVDNKYMDVRLPDGHPASSFNRSLARHIADIAYELWSGDKTHRQ